MRRRRTSSAVAGGEVGGAGFVRRRRGADGRRPCFSCGSPRAWPRYRGSSRGLPETVVAAGDLPGCAKTGLPKLPRARRSGAGPWGPPARVGDELLSATASAKMATCGVQTHHRAHVYGPPAVGTYRRDAADALRRESAKKNEAGRLATLCGSLRARGRAGWPKRRPRRRRRAPDAAEALAARPPTRARLGRAPRNAPAPSRASNAAARRPLAPAASHAPLEEPQEARTRVRRPRPRRQAPQAPRRPR